MSPCPLCLLGYKDPHTKEMWEEFRSSTHLQKQLCHIMNDRRAQHEAVVAAQIEKVREEKGEQEAQREATRLAEICY